jgi:hypothetical protein
MKSARLAEAIRIAGIETRMCRSPPSSQSLQTDPVEVFSLAGPSVLVGSGADGLVASDRYMNRRISAGADAMLLVSSLAHLPLA